MKLLLLCSDRSCCNFYGPLFRSAEVTCVVVSDISSLPDCSVYSAVIVCGDYPADVRVMKEMKTCTNPCILLSGTCSYTALLRFLEDGGYCILPLPGGRRTLEGAVEKVVDDYSLSKETVNFFSAALNRTVAIRKSALFQTLKMNMHYFSHQKRLIRSLLKESTRNLRLGHTECTECPYTHKELEKALADDQFQLYYQPVVDLQDGCRLTGFESLIRWVSSEGELIAPDNFVPVLESGHLIFPVTELMIDQALESLRKWNNLPGTKWRLRININLSTRMFEDYSIADKIIDKTRKAGIPASQLGLEITESAVMGSMENANIILLKLKSQGFDLYMDDFGTGYSSLSYLQHFPVQILKIDKSFVKWLNIDEESEHIVRSIVGLAHGLGRKVVAEGVEEKDHVDFLEEIGCDYGQGYYFAKPMSTKETLNYIDKNL